MNSSTQHLKPKILILGAGPCGLGAAHRLRELGHSNWQVFERNAYVGGLAASFVDNRGFTWDIGGHVLFSHYPYFDRVVAEALGGAWYEHQRESWIRVLHTWVPYPFQNNVRYLPDDALAECVAGLRELAGNPAEATDFRQWMGAVFGPGIVKYFMEPYNRKVWAVPLTQMSKDWIAERVSVIDLARIERNISEKRDDVGWGPNNNFLFPKQGGTGEIYRQIARPFQERIHFNHEMQSIDLANKQIRFTNGRMESYDLLITTCPLDLLVQACVDAPDSLRSMTEGLVHNSGYVVGLGFAGRREDSKCWMYFPEDNSPFYRVTNFHRYAPTNVPNSASDQYFSLMCETSTSPHKPVSAASIVEETIRGLVQSDMIQPGQERDIVSRYVIDIPYSYPVPTLGRDRSLTAIQPYLEERGVFSRGRFGAWKYEVGNMDHSFMQGVEVVDRFFKDADEPTRNGGTPG